MPPAECGGAWRTINIKDQSFVRAFMNVKYAFYFIDDLLVHDIIH